jgi:DNA-binding NtrC family response regulator
MGSKSPLWGRHVLVVEDEAAISLMMTSLLADQGCTVVGPAYTVKEAMTLIEKHKVDCAVLDVRLGDEASYDVADALTSRGIPFIFVTGYEHIDTRFEGVRMIQKPCDAAEVQVAIAEALGSR